MATAKVELSLRSRGASLNVVARELRRMDGRTVRELFKRRLESAARPYPRRVRAAALSIPVKPGGRTTHLRERIAGCVTLSSGTDATSGWVSVWVDVRKMLPDYKTLPLYMEGVRGDRLHRYDRWRHPVFGRRDNPQDWQPEDAHPYFAPATESLGAAGGTAVKAALEDITRKISG
jgi:hypothetical protein